MPKKSRKRRNSDGREEFNPKRCRIPEDTFDPKASQPSGIVLTPCPSKESNRIPNPPKVSGPKKSTTPKKFTSTPVKNLASKRLAKFKEDLENKKLGLSPPATPVVLKSHKTSLNERLKKARQNKDDSVITIADSSQESICNNNNGTLTSSFVVISDADNTVNTSYKKFSANDRLRKLRTCVSLSAMSDSPTLRSDDSISSETIEDVTVIASKSCGDLELSTNSKVHEWMYGLRPTRSADQSTSDSMLVNFNESAFNRTDLLTEPQEDMSMDWEVGLPENERRPEISAKPKLNLTCIITDTNVWMHELSTIRDLLNIPDNGMQKFIVYVPWMVLKELDHIKDQNRGGKMQALDAQRLLNQHLSKPNSRVVGQSVQDLSEQIDIGKSPDEKILACCLQAKAKYESVILLSNDINLRNMALTNDLKAYACRDFSLRLKSSVYTKVKVKMQPLLSQIIFQSCERAYGKAINQMKMLNNGPWAFDGCLKRFKKYWSSVFSQLLLKQCLKVIEELERITEREPVKKSDVDQFKDKVKELLFFLGDIEEFKMSARKTSEEIDLITKDDTLPF